jgi:hypothetical protein
MKDQALKYLLPTHRLGAMTLQGAAEVINDDT